MLEDHIHTATAREALHFRGDVLLVMIDHVIRAQLLRTSHFLIPSGGRDYAAVEELGKLNRGLSDAARCSQHQHIFAGLQSRAREQHVPGSEKHKRRGGRLLETEVVGNWDGGVLGRLHQLAVSALDGGAE
jgi:hypothetical protein